MKFEFFTLDFKDGRWPRFAQPTAEIALFIRTIELRNKASIGTCVPKVIPDQVRYD